MIPSKIDFTRWTREIEDQTTTPICVGDGTVSPIEMISYRAHHNYNLSGMGLFNDTAVYENRVGQNGVAPVDALIVGSTTGIGDEALWPFNPAKLTDTPPPAYYSDAATQKITYFRAIELTKAAIDAELANAHPVLIAADIPNWLLLMSM